MAAGIWQVRREVTRLKIFETCPSRSHATLPFLILRTLLYPTSLLLPCSPGLHGYPIRLFSLKTDMYVYYGLRMDGRTVCFFFFHRLGSASRGFYVTKYSSQTLECCYPLQTKKNFPLICSVPFFHSFLSRSGSIFMLNEIIYLSGPLSVLFLSFR